MCYLCGQPTQVIASYLTLSYNLPVNTQDILNFTLTLGIFIITSCVVIITIFLVQVLKAIIRLSDNLEETAQGIKEKVQMKALAALPAILVSLIGRFIKKRG